MRRKAMVAALAVTTFFGVAACGGSSGGGSGSSGSGDANAGLTSRGPITYVQGKDNSNVVRPAIAKWNAAHPTEKVTFKEQTDQADQQHDDLVQHFQAKDKNYDVVDVDVVWTAEFAAKGWLQPLTDKMAIDTNGLLPATVKTATYNGKMYAAPQASDGGLLYYRSDLVKTPPKTWAEMMADCKIAKQHNIGCYAGQFAKYEGLTVNAAEAINSAGGTIVGKDGPGASSLGGHNAAISVYSDHKATAHDFLKYLNGKEFQKFELEQGSLAPVREDLYHDAALQKKFPYLPTLLTSIQNAVPRPVTPFYPAVTKAVQDNAYAAIKGQKTPEEAVKSMSDAIKAASGS